ncbi:MAG: hypothetical protein ACXABY_34490, partial [Candidatus Thorarchaeota archaeon]
MTEDLNVTQGGLEVDSGFAPTNDVPPGQSESLSTDSDSMVSSGVMEGLDAVSPSSGEEYKPYSQFPWHELPEGTRAVFLEKLKKFHGDMSRGQNEVGRLRQENADYRQKAQWFDELTSQKWFQDAYLARDGKPVDQSASPV